jgi:DeoR/GlpR family transcriptional regulator of sugar metabolism
MCTQTERAILDVAPEVIVLADHSKCGRVDMAFVAPLKTIDIFVTDTDAPKDFVAAIESHNIRVIQA